MNIFRTALLLAAMTALFMGAGYLIGAEQGMFFAFLLALGMNAFAYWNSDKMVLRMYGAREVDAALLCVFDVGSRTELDRTVIVETRDGVVERYWCESGRKRHA